MEQFVEKSVWARRADAAQLATYNRFWDQDGQFFRQALPADNPHNDNFCYWWHAHAIDVLLDGYLRTGSAEMITRIRQVLAGVKTRNNGTMLNNYYDDMEWMALASLRAFDITGDPSFHDLAAVLWRDIKTAWNEQMGGGMAWRKNQLDYKNTPANAPAAILAARLYQRFGAAEDLAWARRILNWNKQTLVDPQTGFVWDGINRQGDGAIDKDWRFTYCQGVFIGACVEMYRITKDAGYLADAVRTYQAADSLADPHTGVLQPEGDGDCGLFKGIFIRYVMQLDSVAPKLHDSIHRLICRNGETLWRQGRNPQTGLFGTDWSAQPEARVDLSTQLSGVMLLEAAASI